MNSLPGFGRAIYFSSERGQRR